MKYLVAFMCDTVERANAIRVAAGQPGEAVLEIGLQVNDPSDKNEMRERGEAIGAAFWRRAVDPAIPPLAIVK